MKSRLPALPSPWLFALPTTASRSSSGGDLLPPTTPRLKSPQHLPLHRVTMLLFLWNNCCDLQFFRLLVPPTRQGVVRTVWNVPLALGGPLSKPPGQIIWLAQPVPLVQTVKTGGCSHTVNEAGGTVLVGQRSRAILRKSPRAGQTPQKRYCKSNSKTISRMNNNSK